ncbi:MPT63 family protein [Mycolicibacterium palauense]|uniref:MPT63 family protein n=1 Tax=Mycolicibacterium palauense TaxID=2034511 RepID=UPI000BFF1924|nr:MPT63 family protein [Mycolicibacterium palauense]
MKISLRTAAVAAAAAAVTALSGAPVSAAEDVTTQPMGSKGELRNGDIVQAWTIADLKPSTDQIPYPVKGQLWEATATDQAVAGTVTPIVSNLNARAADGENYRVLFGVATPQGVNPATLAQGEQTTGKVYFDVTGEKPLVVVYNSMGQDLLAWTPPPPPPAPRSGGSSYSAPASTPATGAEPAEAPADAAETPAGELPAEEVPAGSSGTPLPEGAAAEEMPAGSTGTPLPEGSTGTPLPEGSTGTPLPEGSTGTPSEGSQSAAVPEGTPLPEGQAAATAEGTPAGSSGTPMPEGSMGTPADGAEAPAQAPTQAPIVTTTPVPAPTA